MSAAATSATAKPKTLATLENYCKAFMPLETIALLAKVTTFGADLSKWTATSSNPSFRHTGVYLQKNDGKERSVTVHVVRVIPGHVNGKFKKTANDAYVCASLIYSAKEKTDHARLVAELDQTTHFSKLLVALQTAIATNEATGKKDPLAPFELAKQYNTLYEALSLPAPTETAAAPAAKK